MSTLLTMRFLSLMEGRIRQTLFKITSQNMSLTKIFTKVSWELTATESFPPQNVGREDAQKTKTHTRQMEGEILCVKRLQRY